MVLVSIGLCSCNMSHDKSHSIEQNDICHDADTCLSAQMCCRAPSCTAADDVAYLVVNAPYMYWKSPALTPNRVAPDRCVPPVTQAALSVPCSLCAPDRCTSMTQLDAPTRHMTTFAAAFSPVGHRPASPPNLAEVATCGRDL